jgi:hypothetical protein
MLSELADHRAALVNGDSDWRDFLTDIHAISDLERLIRQEHATQPGS